MLPYTYTYSEPLTASDLLNCKIKVSSQSPEEFYGQPLPSLASLELDPNLVSGTLDKQGLSDETYRLLQSLDLASRAAPEQQSAVDDFMRELLRALGYEMRDVLFRSRYAIPLFRRGNANSTAETDLCLVQGSSTILLVVKVDNLTVGARDPEPQVIAGAIATYQCNNRIRSRLGEPELDSMTIPCIAMTGTRPTFYLVPVTRYLSESIATGHYPLAYTEVKKCVVVSNRRLLSEGMESPDFRQVALQHFTAFRDLAMAHWPAL